MIVITADPSLQNLLAGLKDRAEVHDAQGNLLGYLTPRAVEEELLYQHAARVFDPSEIQRQLAEQKTGMPLDQVLARLHALERP